MTTKELELNNGAIIRRNFTEDNDEIWEIENKALATITVKLNLMKSKNIEVEGFEGEKVVSASAGPLETVELFKIIKTKPFEFKWDITFKEKAMTKKQQKEYTRVAEEEMEQKINEISEVLKDIPFEVLSQEDFMSKLEEFGFSNYIDPSFPPIESSLWKKETDEECPFETLPIWRRPKDFMTGIPTLFEDSIDPNDINQGGLGDCWFLSSLAAIAENPALIKRLFITKEYNEEGIYKLRICKNGEWITVTIDDYIPCHFNGGPMFANNKGDELWAILLEKAYAKIHGSYNQIVAGFNCHGMMDLTGCPTQSFWFPEERNSYKKIKDYAEDLWEKMHDAEEKGHIMCAGTPGIDIYTGKEGPEEEKGLVGGHAYSVIACKSHGNVRLVQIRNPWGQFEWGGKWSDHSEEWTEEYLEAFEPKFDNDDGTFWM
jgi:hypothetical protein